MTNAYLHKTGTAPWVSELDKKIKFINTNGASTNLKMLYAKAALPIASEVILCIGKTNSKLCTQAFPACHTASNGSERGFKA